MPKIRPFVESYALYLLALLIAVLLGCTRCGGGSREGGDSNTAADPPPAQQSDSTPKETENSSKVEPAQPRPPYCLDAAGNTVSVCADDPAVLDTVTSQPK